MILYSLAIANLCAVVKWGDVNADGTTNIIDAQQIARHSVSLSVVDAAAVIARGDLNADGTVNIIDAQQTARYSAGLSTATTRPGADMNAAATVTISVLTPVNQNNGFTPPLFAGVNWPIQLGAVVKTATGTDISSCATVTWSTSDASKGIISSNGTITALATGSPAFIATSGTASAQMTIPTRVPAIGNFIATPSFVSPGQSSLLSWSGVSDAAQCALNNSIGSVSCSGTRTVTPALTTIYTLTATADYGGAVTRDVTVVVPPSGGWGIMGDSWADEYHADDVRGNAYAATTFNWTEILRNYRGFYIGDWGTRPSPRRTGYSFVWALSGETSYTLLSNGQHTGLAAQVQSGAVHNVILQIGTNDFSEWASYQTIYDGTLSGAALQAELDAIYANITTALQTMVNAGAWNIFWLTIPDRGNVLRYRELYPDPVKRQLVTNAIANVNGRVTQYAAAHNIVALDFNAFFQSFTSQANAQGFIDLGGELIDIVEGDDEPHHFLLADRDHWGSVFNALMTNFILAAVKARGAADVPLLTTNEILQIAGIRN